MIFAYLNNQIRLLKIKIRKEVTHEYSELGITKTGDFTYRDHKHNDPRIWSPLGFEGGLKKVEQQVKKISYLLSSLT